MEFLNGVRYFRKQPRYCIYQICGWAILFFGFFAFSLIPICLILGLNLSFDGDFGLVYWPVRIFIGMPIGALIMLLGGGIIKRGERFKYSYVVHMGEVNPEPCLEQYDIREEEFNSYERRFRFRDLDYLLSLGASGLTIFLWFTVYRNRTCKYRAHP